MLTRACVKGNRILSPVLSVFTVGDTIDFVEKELQENRLMRESS